MSDASTSRTGPRASVGIRFVAALLDGIILGVVTGILSGILKGAGSGLSTLISLAYFIYLEGSPSGQTIGKRVMGIRVIDFQTGGPIGYGKAAIRWVGRIVSLIACLLGYLWAIWDPQNQTWHDKMAGSVVVPVADYPVAAWPG